MRIPVNFQFWPPYSQFRLANRVSLIIEDVAWQVLPKMMQVATDIYEGVQRRKASRELSLAQAPASKKAKGGLRARDPW